MLFERNPNAPKTYRAALEKSAMLTDDIALLHVRWVWPARNERVQRHDDPSIGEAGWQVANPCGSKHGGDLIHNFEHSND